MTYVALAALILAPVVTLSLLLYRAQRQSMAVRDLLDAERSLSRQYQSERDLEVTAHAVTRGQLKETQDRLSAAEAQRNEAYREARDHFVARIEKANIADAGRLVADLLATALPGVQQDKPPRSEATGTALLRPGADL